MPPEWYQHQYHTLRMPRVCSAVAWVWQRVLLQYCHEAASKHLKKVRCNGPRRQPLGGERQEESRKRGCPVKILCVDWLLKSCQDGLVGTVPGPWMEMDVMCKMNGFLKCLRRNRSSLLVVKYYLCLVWSPTCGVWDSLQILCPQNGSMAHKLEPLPMTFMGPCSVMLFLHSFKTRIKDAINCGK